MYYKCTRCGETFDEPYFWVWKEHHGDGFYEDWAEARCPECYSDDIEEADTCCDCCGEHFTADELYSGYCEACVRDALEADRFFRWSGAGATETEYSSFEDFIFTEIFRISKHSLPKGSSFERREYLKDIYRAVSKDDDFTDKAWQYLKDTANVEDFVEWLAVDERKEVS